MGRRHLCNPPRQNLIYQLLALLESTTLTPAVSNPWKGHESERLAASQFLPPPLKSCKKWKRLRVLGNSNMKVMQGFLTNNHEDHAGISHDLEDHARIRQHLYILSFCCNLNSNIIWLIFLDSWKVHFVVQFSIFLSSLHVRWKHHLIDAYMYGST